jgi:group I intron endonuclease
MCVGIYIIKNNINNKIYVGSTLKSFDIRFKTHKKQLQKNTHENPILQNAWNKYGESGFSFNIIESYDDIEINKLLELERKYILLYDSNCRDFGYNICSVGKSRLGTKWSEESKIKRRGGGNPM